MIRLLIIAAISFTLAAAEVPTKAPCAAVRIGAPLAVTPAQVGIGGLPLAFLQLGPGPVPCDGHPEKYVCTWACISVNVPVFFDGWIHWISQTVCYPRCECLP